MHLRFFVYTFIFLFAFTTLASKGESEGGHRESILAQSREFEKDMELAGSFLDDTALVSYLNSILQHLIPREYYERQLQVRVLKSSTMNAFATPHGSIYICTGLLAQIENEAQAASLLAHELTHIVNDHAYKNLIITKENALSSAQLQIGLDFFIGPLAGAIRNVTLKSAITGYSRDLEREADSLGLIKIKEARYAPIEFCNLFLLLKKHIELGNINEPFFFATHPAISERISNYYELAGHDSLRAIRGIVNPVIFTKKIINVLLIDGTMKIASGNLDIAERSFLRILDIDTCNSQALTHLGDIARLRALPKFNNDVLKWYYKAKNCDNSVAESLMKLGFYYFTKGKTDSASYFLNTYMKQSPSSPYTPIIEDYLKQCDK